MAEYSNLVKKATKWDEKWGEKAKAAAAAPTPVAPTQGKAKAVP